MLLYPNPQPIGPELDITESVCASVNIDFDSNTNATNVTNHSTKYGVKFEIWLVLPTLITSKEPSETGHPQTGLVFSSDVTCKLGNATRDTTV
jgi:hypothetical protein